MVRCHRLNGCSAPAYASTPLPQPHNSYPVHNECFRYNAHLHKLRMKSEISAYILMQLEGETMAFLNHLFPL